MIVMKDRDTKALFADVVELKGRGLAGTVERVVDNIRRRGHRKLIIKTDQEPALLDLVNWIIDLRDEATIPDNSPVVESRSNGVIDRGVTIVKEQVRTLRLAL